LGWSGAPYNQMFTLGTDENECGGAATFTSTDFLTFQVNPVAVGYCKIILTGGAGLTKTIWISISTVTIGVNGRPR